MVFMLFLVFNRRRIKFIMEKQEAQRQAEFEFAKIRIENQEHLLKNISWELHDNIGQLLSVSKMQLSMLPERGNDSEKKIVNDTIDIISRVLEDIRSLSKSLNTESIGFMGMIKATRFEIERLNRLKFINAKFKIKGEPVKLKNDDEIVIFRIIQELMSNVIKHARASDFEIVFSFGKDVLEITATDNGVGMKTKTENYGLGLKNIVSRINLLGGSINFENRKEGGLRTKIKCPMT
jgi:two-component system, NarL family, sensor kinase